MILTGAVRKNRNYGRSSLLVMTFILVAALMAVVYTLMHIEDGSPTRAKPPTTPPPITPPSIWPPTLHPTCTRLMDVSSMITGANAVEAPAGVPIFYHLFIKNPAEIPRVQTIVSRQLDEASLRHPVHITSVGTPLPVKNMDTMLECKDGHEFITLHELWKFCRNNRDSKAIYLHSKGSYHDKKENTALNIFLTGGALSNECANLPTTCNVCSSRMSPLPHPHTPGNMWLARCSYVAELADPLVFQKMMEGVHPKSNACTGHNRYASEHWVHSHPDVQPCDLYPFRDDVNDFSWGYSNVPSPANFSFELRTAPRAPMDLYHLEKHCLGIGESLKGRLQEFNTLYDKQPPGSWYGWSWYRPRS